MRQLAKTVDYHPAIENCRYDLIRRPSVGGRILSGVDDGLRCYRKASECSRRSERVDLIRI